MNSATMSKTSLQKKILSLFALVLVIISGIVAFTTLRATFVHLNNQLDESFSTSQEVFLYKLANDGNLLKGNLENAAKDFNTKELIADGENDPESLRAVMVNQQNRSNADFALVLNKQLKPLVSTLTDTPAFNPSHFNTQQSRFLQVGDKVYLVKVAAVKFLEQRPSIDAWLVMGLDIEKLINPQLKALTGFDISAFAENQLIASTVTWNDKSEASPLAHIGPLHASSITVNNELLLGYRFFAEQGAEDVTFVFTILRDDAHLDFFQLAIQLFIVLAFAIVLAFVGSYYISRGITRPVRLLANIAERIQNGDYKSEIPSFNTNEVNGLASAFTSMQDSINVREQQIEKLAYFDTLTGLPNRTAFEKKLDERISRGNQAPCAVIMINLDRFKDVNDTLGHDFGDKLLLKVAERFDSLQLKNAYYARLGGDEFGIVLEHLEGFELSNVLEQFSSFFELPFEIEDVLLDTDASMGVAVYPEHSEQLGGLLQCADIALHRCKTSHKDFLIYDECFNTHSVQKLSLMSELRLAIEKNQLNLFYQPKLDLNGEKIVSVECLVRWIHPEHGFIGPDDFIPLAEKTGAIRDLTQWAIKTAIAQHLAWKEKGKDLRMAINISALDLVDLSLPAYVAEMLSETNVAAEKITLEVTESAVMSDPDQAIKALNMLKRMGINLSIDDFGTGFSSMTQLKKMPVSELKIDKSFVLELATNKDDESIVKSTVDLAHNLGLKVVAEGVEDNASLEKLVQHKVEYAQGYFIAKPMPADLFDEWMLETHYDIKEVS